MMSSEENEKYINKVESRLNSSSEKKSKGFAFGRLYYDAKDYKLSKEYLEEYIRGQDKDFRVYNLLGEVNEELGNYEEAFRSYERSLELNSSQKDILIKVMIICTKCLVDPWRVKILADEGAKHCPGHPAVFDVKWHILSQKSPKDYEEMELLIVDELSRRANDSSLHIKLVKLYMETEAIHQAYKYCESVENTGLFDDDLQWLICATDLLDLYRKTEDGAAASFTYAISLCKLMNVQLKSSSGRDCITTMKRMDKALNELENTQSLGVQLGAGQEMSDALNEMKKQLYKNTTTYIMKLALELQDLHYQNHWESLQRIAVVYMKEAIQILEIHEGNKRIAAAEEALAETLLVDGTESLMRKGYLRLAELAMLSDDLDEALKLYDKVNSVQAVYSQAQIYMKLASECDLDTINGEKDHLYYTTKAKEKLNLCIRHADHSPGFKATLLEHLHEMEQATANALANKMDHSKPRNCLNSASTTPQKESSTKSDFMEETPLIISDNLPMESACQDQLNAKEKENQILRQTLEMYKTQMHLQTQRQQQFLVQPQFAIPSQPIGAPGQYIVQKPPQLIQHPVQVQSGALIRPVVSAGPVFPHTMQPSPVPPNLNRQVNRVNSNGTAVITPTFRNGIETPTDMWWDSFSPQASFEKGYFAGLAEHAVQSRELLGETEAPTMLDADTTPTTDKTSSINETPKNDSLNKILLSATRMQTFDGDGISVEPIANLEWKGPCKTNEEDEVVKFRHRAKLYRFDKDVNQLKERDADLEESSTEVKKKFKENSEGNLKIMNDIEKGDDDYQGLASNSSCRRSNEVMGEEVDESKQVEER